MSKEKGGKILMKEKPAEPKPPHSKNGSSNGSEGGTKTFGPIFNFEEHLQPDWWRHIFNPIYLKTDADVIGDQQITTTEVDLFLEILKLSPESKILDLCCGQGRHSLELARRGFTYIRGLDRSHYLIQKAKTQAKKEGLPIKFREGDARKLPFPTDSFDVVTILGNSFGYFETIQDDVRVLKEIFRVLKPWGRLLIDVADGEYLRSNFQPRSWEWIDKKYFVCRERSFSLDKQRLITREIVNHVEKGIIVDQFYAERIYTKDSLADVMKTSGFSDVSFYGTISADSKRNQDLGMMERRIILTAVVRKKWSPIKRKKEEIKNVVVVLGDPKKPDPLKPLGLFDEDDFFTIDQLKGALRELEQTYNYQFAYLNNHDTIIPDLLKLKEKQKVDYVFNLCDEGYLNDPRKELNIPALMDILGIPYTGAIAQCLAFCYDKSLVRGIAKEMGIPVPEAIFIKPEDTTFEIPFPFPVIVKPNFGDSSFGITQRCVVNTPEELLNAILEIREKFGYDKPILIEEFLIGKDLSLGVIGNSPGSYNVLPIIEEDYSLLPPELPRICGYEAKWLPDSPYWNIKSVPAKLPEEMEKSIVDSCLKLFERLEVKDYGRFDWRIDAEGTPKILEVNPNPGWCWDGHLAKMAKFAGMSYAEMIGKILHSAERRIGI